eukprot:COSAG02_NODE_95_length_37416_cov_60.512742_16_plen_50_part_00
MTEGFELKFRTVSVPHEVYGLKFSAVLVLVLQTKPARRFGQMRRIIMCR